MHCWYNCTMNGQKTLQKAWKAFKCKCVCVCWTSVCGPNAILCMFGKCENERNKKKKTNSLLGKLNNKPQGKTID